MILGNAIVTVLTISASTCVARLPATSKAPVAGNHYGVKIANDYHCVNNWNNEEIRKRRGAPNTRDRDMLDELPHAVNTAGGHTHWLMDDVLRKRAGRHVPRAKPASGGPQTQRESHIASASLDHALFPVPLEDDKVGYINTAGLLVLRTHIEIEQDDFFSFVMYHTFSEGMLRFRQDRRFGYIDTNGNVVIAPRFLEAGQFSEGLARVYVGGHYGLRRNGFGRGVSGGKWGYIDTTGKMVIEPRFDHAHDFADALACVGISVSDKYAKFGYVEFC